MADRTSRPGPRGRAVTLGAALVLTLGVTAGCSDDPGTVTAKASASATAVSAPAPTADQIVKDAVTLALKSSTAQFTFAVRSSGTGYSTRANGTGTVDLARGRLDQVQRVRSSTGGWQSRYLIVGKQAYVKNLSGAKQGAWWQAAVDGRDMTFTRDGYADPLEFLRLLLTLEPGVTVVGDRVIQGDDVVAYDGFARPSKAIGAAYRRPGRKPGQLAGNLRYLTMSRVAVRVYLDGKGLPMRIVLSGTGSSAGGSRPKVAATLTTVGWGTPQAIRRPAFEVPTFDQLYG